MHGATLQCCPFPELKICGENDAKSQLLESKTELHREKMICHVDEKASERCCTEKDRKDLRENPVTLRVLQETKHQLTSLVRKNPACKKRLRIFRGGGH